MTDRLSLAARIKASAKLTGNFILRSGAASNTYFDKYRFESDPALSWISLPKWRNWCYQEQKCWLALRWEAFPWSLCLAR